MLAHDALPQEPSWHCEHSTIVFLAPEAIPAAAPAVPAAGSSTGGQVTVPLSSVPALSSLPGAPITLYLDFDGDSRPQWGDYHNLVTPAFDQDGDPTSFSEAELAAIRQIWQQVAEDYAPFGVNVTTVQPSNMAPGSALQVVIGGAGAWTGGTFGGMAFVGSFHEIENTVFVFSANLASGNPKYTADSIAHESGHGFGLDHQSLYDASGVKTHEYAPGGADGRGPLMGNCLASARGVWWSGTSSSATNYQDDMAVLAGALGVRPDDHGNDIAHATSLAASGSTISAAGIIETTTDVDYFAFETGPGTITVTVTPLSPGGNLDARLELRDATGVLLVVADSVTSTSASITALVPPGSYRLVVGSHGAYGDVGQYTLSGTIVPLSVPPAAPTQLTASASNNLISLAWIDNADNELGFRVFRSVNGTNWSLLASLPANATAMVDATEGFGAVYYYQVQATSHGGSSPMSNVASAITAPAPPGALIAKAVSTSRIDLTWGNVAREDLYRIERSLDGGATWESLATVGADVTSFQDAGLAEATTYHYRVGAANGSGASYWSIVASATTASPSLTPPAAPTKLSAAALSTRQVELRWIDSAANERSFRVERSGDGGKTWSPIASLGANVVRYTDLTVTAGRTFRYRVASVNDAGASAFAIVSVTTPALPRVRPSMPTGLKTAGATSAQVSLRWNDIARNEIGFLVERSHDNGRTWKRIAQTTANVTAYVDQSVAAGKSYRYRVRAYNEAGASGSMTVSAAIPASAAAAGPALAGFTSLMTSSRASTARDAAFSDLIWLSGLGHRAG